MESYTLMALERERAKIATLVTRMARFYLRDPRLTNSFISSENTMASNYISLYKSGRWDFAMALMKLHEQYKILEKKEQSLRMESVKFYAIMQVNKDKNSLLTITLKRVGFVGGGLQAITGGAICVASLGLACASLGVPLMAHGAENTWENGYYLLWRENPTATPLRDAYREIGSIFGQQHRVGDIAYSIGDLALSVGALFRTVLKPDTWKLFRYIKDDYIIGWKEMGAVGLTSEIVGDTASGFSVYQLMGNGATDWEKLSENEVVTPVGSR